jgi:alkylation response protein AidB-like acyl-CoA dehydrogenase
MSFQLTAEQKMVRLMAKDFARKELEPEAAKRDKEEIFPVDVVKKMGRLGLLGMMVPVEVWWSWRRCGKLLSGSSGNRLFVRINCSDYVCGQSLYRAVTQIR